MKRITATSYGGRVIFNGDVLKETVQNVLSKQDLVRELNGRDASVVVLKSVLIHEFSHENESAESFQIDPLDLVTAIGTFVFNRIKSFKFEGKAPDGSNFMIPGANEALTEYTAYKLGKRTGIYIFGCDEYSYGGGFVEDLHNRSGISETDHLQIYYGERSLSALLRKWGQLKNPNNPNIPAAELTLLAIGLCTQGTLTPEQALQQIKRNTKP